MSPFIQSDDDPEENRARRSGEFSLDVDGETMFRMLKRSGEDELCTDNSATAARARAEQKAQDLRKQVSRLAEAARRTPPAKQLPLSRLDDSSAEKEAKLKDQLDRIHERAKAPISYPEPVEPPAVDYKKVVNDSLLQAVKEGIADEGNGLTLLCEFPREAVDGGSHVLRLVLKDGGKTIASRSLDFSGTVPVRAGEELGGLLPSIVDFVEKSSEFLGVHIETSLAGYGVDPTTPMASAEGATSAGGDIVRDGTDTAPGSRTPVEESDATGATTCEGSPRWSRPTKPTNGSEVDDDQ
ncbi:hypothetical protein [Brevibacterium sp. K72]|uniref:hypothetical protein n=1 Tax=Brevibacterium sp. K72 TaxID=3390729 RepID=UPI003D2FE501